MEQTSANFAEDEEAEVMLEDTGLTAVALYDYQAAADDEISFDPDDIITHVQMVIIYTDIIIISAKIIFYFLFRLMKDGGEVFAGINMVYFRRITYNFSSDKYISFYILTLHSIIIQYFVRGFT